MMKACENHINLCRKAMTGQGSTWFLHVVSCVCVQLANKISFVSGVDRHLFSLYVVSQYLRLDVPFLKTVS